MSDDWRTKRFEMRDGSVVEVDDSGLVVSESEPTLAPPSESIVLACKPLDGTVANNVLTHGTGALNIDASRVEYQSDADKDSAKPGGDATSKVGALAGGTQNDAERTSREHVQPEGRFPANVLLSHHEGCGRGTETMPAYDCHPDCPIRLLDEQSGTTTPSVRSAAHVRQQRGEHEEGVTRFDSAPMRRTEGYSDSGGASRFFQNFDAEPEAEAPPPMPPPMPVDVKIEIPYDQIVVAVEYDEDESESEPTSLIELDGATLYLGKCEEVMATLPESSIDAIVCDPPYGLEFMGKEFDKLGDGPGQQAWHYRWAVEAFRVLKPGGHIIAFGGTRTYHRLASAIEDAGFEVRDQLQYLYGSGFPKSMNVSKAIDKAAGAERGIEARSTVVPFGSGNPRCSTCGRSRGSQPANCQCDTTGTPATPEAQQWDGWGTALKPAHEPAILARKPLKGTVANNVLTHGTGALNIDASRVGDGERVNPAAANKPGGSSLHMSAKGMPQDAEARVATGRWPANVLLTHHEDCVEVGTKQVKRNIIEADYKDMDSTVYAGRQDGSLKPGSRSAGVVNETVPTYNCHPDCPIRMLDDQTSGGASRFFQNFEGESRFIYSAKASKSERERGMPKREDGKRANNHPTVKPIKVMEYLIRLVTPPGGTVLDPFMGSGSTGVAAVNLGFDFAGIELEPDYIEIAKARIAHAIGERE